MKKFQVKTIRELSIPEQKALVAGSDENNCTCTCSCSSEKGDSAQVDLKAWAGPAAKKNS